MKLNPVSLYIIDQNVNKETPTFPSQIYFSETVDLLLKMISKSLGMDTFW